ncbi:hypothetical protein, partial [Salmonella enterica]|uniref:hypothetical protein n=1 Tax=Salmonella enterica TaxID=28901 RepID=UPI0022B6676F
MQQKKQSVPVSNALLDSFASDRTRYIADAFVEHLDLDDPDIKEHARGQTTLDKQRGRAAVAEAYLLSLVPFYSAIGNFQQGNYGEGA